MLQTKDKKWHVLTGGPCAGKTTLITKFKELGYAVIPEAAREVIEEAARKGIDRDVLRGDVANFVRLVHEKEFALLDSAPKEGVVFFDRSFIDSIAYGRVFNNPGPERHNALALTKPFEKIFLLDLVGYVQDDARNETPEQAAQIHKILGEVYREYGFEVITVPVMPVIERAEYILARV